MLSQNDVQEAMSNMLRTLTSMAAEPRLAEAIATALPQKGPLPLGNKAYSSALRSAIIALYSALAQHAGAVDDKVPVEQKATMKLYTTVPDAAHRVFTEAIKDADETVQSSAINALHQGGGQRACRRGVYQERCVQTRARRWRPAPPYVVVVFVFLVPLS